MTDIMTQEEKQLLFKDLCARLPYGVKMKYIFDDGSHCPFELSTKILQECFDKGFLPYLRPMSSMTEEEKNEYIKIVDGFLNFENAPRVVDWLNAHHFDYRTDPSTGKTLIESELAIKAPEDMYKTE